MSDFIEVTDENFEEHLSKQKLALVDFYASWCGSCRMAAPMFKKVGNELNLTLFKVDAEKNPGARTHAKVTTLPTVALVKDGQVVASLSTTKEEGLRDFLNEHGVK